MTCPCNFKDLYFETCFVKLKQFIVSFFHCLKVFVLASKKPDINRFFTENCLVPTTNRVVKSINDARYYLIKICITIIYGFVEEDTFKR